MKDTESTSTSTSAGTEMGNIYISSEQIIQEVQKFRCLYDPADPDHKDRDVMRDAWLTVTQAVVGEPWAKLNNAEKNEAAKEVQRRWKNVRDAMRKSLNPRCARNSQKGRKPYAFHNELAFLLETEYFKNISETDDAGGPRKTLLRIRPKRSPSVVNDLDETSATYEADEQSETSDSCQATPSPRHKRKKNKPQQIIQTPQKDSSEKEHPSVFVPYSTSMPESQNYPNTNYPCPQSTRMPERENADRMFLLSLLPSVSALSSRDKLDFQIKAMQMLQGFEKD